MLNDEIGYRIIAKLECAPRFPQHVPPKSLGVSVGNDTCWVWLLLHKELFKLNSMYESIHCDWLREHMPRSNELSVSNKAFSDEA